MSLRLYFQGLLTFRERKKRESPEREKKRQIQEQCVPKNRESKHWKNAIEFDDRQSYLVKLHKG